MQGAKSPSICQNAAGVRHLAVGPVRDAELVLRYLLWHRILCDLVQSIVACAGRMDAAVTLGIWSCGHYRRGRWCAAGSKTKADLRAHKRRKLLSNSCNIRYLGHADGLQTAVFNDRISELGQNRLLAPTLDATA